MGKLSVTERWRFLVHEFKSTMDRNFVNGYLGIDESYKMPERMMELLLNAEEREKMFDAFSAENPDMTGDLWHEYFQDEQGDRNALKQDFTPMEICQLVAEITPEAESYADVCAGTGGLTIALHNRFPDAYYHLEEISERTIPILLFNLAIRNINAEVINGDNLEQTAKHYYRVVPGRKYGTIDEVDGLEPRSFGAVVSNPPYSLQWNPEGHGADERFTGYELAPKSKADYAFILHGMSLTSGIATYILPHGVLFRGQKEGKIREKLCRDGRIRSIIGLPNNMFRNTGIPVCIVQICTGAQDTLIIDAADECTKDGKYNVMKAEHLNAVLGAYRIRKSIDKLSQLVTLPEIENNDYNLNIPRYVDKFEPEQIPDIITVMAELKELNKEIYASEKSLQHMIGQLVAIPEREEELEAIKKVVTENGQLAFKF